MFSYKYGYSKQTDLESITPILRNRIWNYFYQRDIQKAFGKRMAASLKLDMSIEKLIGDRLGFDVSDFNLLKRMKKYVIKDCKWYEVYDFIEIYLSFVGDKKGIISDINRILTEEQSQYRIVNGEIAPLNNEFEISEIESVINSPYDSVNTHFSKALSLFSDRSKPDYENTIKESISAVEAMCCIILGNDKATLGQALKKLEENDVYIHKSLRNGFSSLYGYASDESGIRHGSVDFVNVSAEDAKFMLVSCSAFVNYLIEKWSKVVEKQNG